MAKATQSHPHKTHRSTPTYEQSELETQSSTTTGLDQGQTQEASELTSDQPTVVIIEDQDLNVHGYKRRSYETSYENSPSMTEQHLGHLGDVNYLVKKYQPNELAMYLQARSQHKTEILGHDFSKEPSLVHAMQIALDTKKHFENLAPEIRDNFPNHLAFLKFINDPRNLDKMHKLGLVTDEQMKAFEPLTTRPIEKKQEDPLVKPDSPLAK